MFREASPRGLVYLSRGPTQATVRAVRKTTHASPLTYTTVFELAETDSEFRSHNRTAGSNARLPRPFCLLFVGLAGLGAYRRIPRIAGRRLSEASGIRNVANSAK
ncbi:unnamed protein product [Trichogramma brassicae]|uniref:Uncharacterized protein n=1 Tax=Trichogramma brassicae TaxID=86971 RepID=A0A6H5ITJ5_9HYME|nr:unnamed protein product [Trichogramma brassicae]